MQRRRNWPMMSLRKIKAGMTFAQAAAQYSDDTESKAKGGVVDAYVKGVFGDAFDQGCGFFKISASIGSG